eukprot:1461293-Amphidinium_carterae.1
MYFDVLRGNNSRTSMDPAANSMRIRCASRSFEGTRQNPFLGEYILFMAEGLKVPNFTSRLCKNTWRRDIWSGKQPNVTPFPKNALQCTHTMGSHVFSVTVLRVLFAAAAVATSTGSGIR